MKIRTLRHIVKEGMVNTYRNKLMSLASVIIVVASLMVFGFFLLTSYNLDANIRIWKEQPQIEAFCYEGLDDTQVNRIEEIIKKNDKIAEYTKITEEEAFKRAQERLGKGSKLLEGLNVVFPVSFIIKLKDTSYSQEVVEGLQKISGIDTVSYSQNTIDIISRVSYWLKLASSLLVTVFLIVSIFIISNTIKLTVFARRREISIMKYIGATDWFIRWPFIVEGVIISLIGALISFILSAYGYNTIEERFSQDLFLANTQLLVLVKIREVWSQLALFYFAIATAVGAIGSLISLRKHLRV
ncbi:MAG: permease-like cell division protein FtsX [Acetivibrionales bacterium]|jgi:cell division transport system permease protein